MADRNVWDPVTPPSYTNLKTRGLVVELCVYVFEHSVKNEVKVRADVQEASEIWCPSSINIQVINFMQLPSFRPSEPLDLNSTDLAGQISCNSLPDAVRDQFFNIVGPECPDITKSVAVFYIPGRRFQDGFSTGCHRFRVQGIDRRPEHLFLLTDEVNGRVLAHELGHALFTRESAPHTWINDDPDPGMDVSNKIHNSNPGNLMFPKVPANPVISTAQSSQAKKCDLILDQRLTYEFKENKNYKLGVKLKQITVHSSSDEATSDDALESSWAFKVSIVKNDGLTEVDSKTETWNQDPLHWWNYDLNLDFPSLSVSSDTDMLEIEANGSDWDFWSPNDALAPVKKEWPKGVDMWGSDSTDTSIPDAQKGDHRESHVSNAEIDYSLTYNIRVDDEPRDVVFRKIC